MSEVAIFSERHESGRDNESLQTLVHQSPVYIIEGGEPEYKSVLASSLAQRIEAEYDIPVDIRSDSLEETTDQPCVLIGNSTEGIEISQIQRPVVVIDLEDRYDKDTNGLPTKQEEGVWLLSGKTDDCLPQELADRIIDHSDYSDNVPQWEYVAVQETLANLSDFRSQIGGRMHKIDSFHFTHGLEAIRYHAEQLLVSRMPGALSQIRGDLKERISDCWSSLIIKEAPRFFRDREGELSLDLESEAWTPHYYKIAEAWPVLDAALKGKEILDPFGGAGTLMNVLIARGLPSGVVLSDLAYAGGSPINDKENVYAPELNFQITQSMYSNLPSWYRPDRTIHKGYVTADARRLPFQDGAVDYVVGDPPYGRRHSSGGLQLLLETMDESLRVSREGAIFLMPADWPEEISAAGYDMELLTHEVSRGQSDNPVCYVRINKLKGEGL